MDRVVMTPTNMSGATTAWRSAGDSCGYYALQPGQSCRQPRSCYDCLNARVAAEPNGCFISSSSACESMSDYSDAMNYRRNDSSVDNGDVDNPKGGWFHEFPSTDTTYCEAQDPACVRCHEIAVNASRENNYLASTTKFCTGQSGCVCIVGCESPTRWRVVQPQCKDPLSSSSTSNASSTASVSPAPSTKIAEASAGHGASGRVVIYVFVSQLVMFVVIIYARARWLRHRRRHPKAPAHQLQLSGWRAMHEELIEREKNRPVHVESTLNSALPPAAPAVSPGTTDPIAGRPPLMTRMERYVWRNADGA